MDMIFYTSIEKHVVLIDLNYSALTSKGTSLQKQFPPDMNGDVLMVTKANQGKFFYPFTVFITIIIICFLQNVVKFPS